MNVADFSPAKKALLMAVKDNKVDKVRSLLTNQPNQLSPNEVADSAQNRILHRAARYGHPQIVELLLKEFGASVNEMNKFGMTALHHGTVAGNPEVVQLLIQSGGNANQPDNSGRLPLHWAAVYGFHQVADILINQGGAKFDCRDKDGFTPLHRCCQEKPTSKELENSEIDPIVAFKEEDVKRSLVAKILLTHGADPNARETQGSQTPLHLCAMNGYSKTAKVLVEHPKVDVNALNKIGLPPLMYGCTEDKPEIVAELLKCGNINLSICDKIHNNWNCLHKAILQDNVETVRLLVEAGADINARDGIGRTALILADDHCKPNVLQYLKTL